MDKIFKVSVDVQLALEEEIKYLELGVWFSPLIYELVGPDCRDYFERYVKFSNSDIGGMSRAAKKSINAFKTKTKVQV